MICQFYAFTPPRMYIFVNFGGEIHKCFKHDVRYCLGRFRVTRRMFGFTRID